MNNVDFFIGENYICVSHFISQHVQYVASALMCIHVGLRGTHFAAVPICFSHNNRRSSVSFGWLHKEVKATEALKWEGVQCLHFHSSSIFHEDSSLSIKWSLVDKWRAWFMLCFRYMAAKAEGASVSLRKTSCLSTQTQALAQGRTDITIRGTSEGLAIMLHIRRQVAGWVAEQWGDGEACCWGEHTFPQCASCHDGVNAGTLSAVAAAGKPQEVNNQGMQIKMKKWWKGRGQCTNQPSTLTACVYSRTVCAVWVEKANGVIKKVKNITWVAQGTRNALFHLGRSAACCSFLPGRWRSALQRSVKRKRLK